MSLTLTDLKEKGFKVRIQHFRYRTLQITDAVNLPRNFTILGPLEPEKAVPGPERSPRGGGTIVKVTRDGKDYVGTAECSLKDGFDRKRGVRICLGRLERLLA